MKTGPIIAAALLHTWSGVASIIQVGNPSVRVLPRALIPRAGRDCGKFVMFCEKAAGACNNACYHINCIDETSKTMVFDAGQTNDRNRKQSGCETADGSVCNRLPFSQRFKDPLDDSTANCDEWPMASIKQDDFKEGTIRNSLRCMPSRENSSGGAQLQAFLAGKNQKGPRKTCDGDVRDGDYWTIDFNLDNTPIEKISHCKEPYLCDGDSSQFHLTKKPTEKGKLSFPYDKDGNDNHYAIGRNEPDLLQCRVQVQQQDGSETKATVYDPTGKKVGDASGQLEDILTLKGLPLDLIVWRVEKDGDAIRFNYGGEVSGTTGQLKWFFWMSDDKGMSKQFDRDGKYCKNKPNGVTECYFPCPEK